MRSCPSVTWYTSGSSSITTSVRGVGVWVCGVSGGWVDCGCECAVSGDITSSRFVKSKSPNPYFHNSWERRICTCSVFNGNSCCVSTANDYSWWRVSKDGCKLLSALSWLVGECCHGNGLSQNSGSKSYDLRKKLIEITRSCKYEQAIRIVGCLLWCPYKQATLYNTARLMGLKVSIACVWTCVSRPPSIIQPG